MVLPKPARFLDRLRRSPSEPVLRPLNALAFVVVGVALALLLHGAWWRFALYVLFVAGVVFALFVRDLSGTPAGIERSSSELARSALKTTALTLLLMALIAIAIYLASR
jgi:hypothetical protein